MISKSQIKTITSLQQKKYRDTKGLFVAEGPKIIKDIYASGVSLEMLFATSNFLETDKFTLISEKDLPKISNLKTPHTGVALFKKPTRTIVSFKGLTVALDAVRDPGNLGTIIRLCDWFGVQQLLCSIDTVDCYNAKVIQATMGSIGRISIHYVDLETVLETSKIPVYGAVMNGENIYKQSFKEDAILVMGNEANGISNKIEALLSHKVTIPQYGSSQDAESLNVATATAILVGEFKRVIGM